jgi:serine/threonine protein kinase
MNNNNTSHALHNGFVLEGALYKYKIMKVLGQGSFGITYLANVQMKGKLGTLDSNMTVAIKEFYMRDINGRDGQTVTSGNKGGLFDDYKKKFEREATNLSKLEHPNIVKVLESFEANGTIYYIMEYIDGVSLDKKIEEKKRLDYKTCIKYTKQIGSALAFMHQEHMLHLDVKPANVMLRNCDDAVLIDFGLSKQYDENGEPESSTKVGGGTPGYAPLEQANYHEGKDFPAVMDVYALGATMFKMLSGCRPPEASDILNDGFPEKDLEVVNVPQQLIGCIEKAMNPTKKSRYQTITSFIDAIESVKNEIETSEETTVEVSVVDDIPDAEAEVVDVQKVDSKTYQVHTTNRFSDKEIKPVNNNIIDGQGGPKHTDGHDSTGKKNNHRVNYYYGIGAAVLLIIVALCWVLNRSVPNDPTEQIDMTPQHVGNTMPSNLNNGHNNAPRLFNNSYYWNGNWKDGKPNGEGIISYPSDDKDGRKEYKGYVSNGLRNDNSAVLTYTNGNSFNGSFVNDKLNKGKLILRSDGMYFEGSFKDNQPYNGKWYYTDGSLYSTVTNGIEK